MHEKTGRLLEVDERNGHQIVTAGGVERLIELLPARRPKRALLKAAELALFLLMTLLESHGNVILITFRFCLLTSSHRA